MEVVYVSWNRNKLARYVAWEKAQHAYMFFGVSS